MDKIKLTQFSHGAGCGCKISPKILEDILSQKQKFDDFPGLIVGNEYSDDAAVFELANNQLVISTTDFFMPIVDDPFDFGAIASVNAVSDVYAMGGAPIMAISILGWPLDKIAVSAAREVIHGAQHICQKAGIPLAGGHSIDTTEPIFGLAVTGITTRENLRTNAGATKGCQLYLTKPLGTGIMSTAQKKGVLEARDFETAKKTMLTLNNIGQELGKLPSVKSVTDVSGFGLLGHLIEMCRASNLSAEILFKKIERLAGLDRYIQLQMFPGGTRRNFNSYGHHVSELTEIQKVVLCDPQTSGGLLIAVENPAEDFKNLLKSFKFQLQPIGRLVEKKDKIIYVL